MSYQSVRGYFENQMATALTAAGVTNIFFDNVGETPPSSNESYAVLSLSFGPTVVDTLSCEGLEDLKGTMQVNVYTPKNQGSKQGEDLCLVVIKAWNTINQRATNPFPLLSASVRSIEGPITLAADARPHHVNVINAVFHAKAA